MSANPTWSPDGLQIAFAGAMQSTITSNIWLANADGSSAHPLTQITALLADSLHPAWSPDGTKLAFDSFRALDGSDAANSNGTSNNIWIVHADGSGATPLTQLTAQFAGSSHPVWSPDGTRIAFISNRALDGSNAANGGAENVWAMKADGSGATPLTQLTVSSFSHTLVWSPDGTHIAFSSDRALNGSNASNGSAENIWVVNADGSSITPLTKYAASTQNLVNRMGQWSPDGTKILFSSQGMLDGSDAPNPAVNIWVMNANGSNATPLTKLTAEFADSFDPAWATDGTRIAFTSGRALDGSNASNGAKPPINGISGGAPTNIWVMNTDGSNQTPLTKSTSFIPTPSVMEPPSPVEISGPRWHP
jgi:Tol biopolymer transport system component